MSVQQSKLPLSVDTVEWTPESAKQIGLELEGSSPETVLRWGFENFGPTIVMATGFGPEGIVLMHLVSEIRPETIVFYLDTDFKSNPMLDMMTLFFPVQKHSLILVSQ